MLGKMAIVARGDSIMVFKAAGVDAYPAENEKAAKELLRKIAKDYSIIFLTEEFSKPLEGFLKRFDEEPYPVILSVPGEDGGTDYGMARLKDAMERALGVDILFNKDGEVK